MLRLEEEQWQLVQKAAADSGVTVAEWLRAAVQGKLDNGDSPSPGGVTEALRLVSEVARQLSGGWVLVPGNEAESSAGPVSWSGFLSHGESG